MASKSETLTSEEFDSLLTVGSTSAVTSPPAAIPAEHSVRLIALGYMVDVAGRLRMTTHGRMRIYAGQLAT
jgi:hypothetical protein